jgi:thiamine biosynthesis lipoprotein
MGTVVSIRFQTALPPATVLAGVEQTFAELDARYSLYKPNSEMSRIASGVLRLQDASPQLRETYSIALDWRARTGGAFTAHRPDGVIDLSGVVKAIAIAAAARKLESAGFDDWILNAGGDIAIGSAIRTTPWTVGIIDPGDRTALLTSLALTGARLACATSGSAERGDHIWAAQVKPEFAQVTVVGDDIVTADVLATAIIAGGPETLDLACRMWSIDVMAIDIDGNVRMTPGAREAMQLARGELSTPR